MQKNSRRAIHPRPISIYNNVDVLELAGPPFAETITLVNIQCGQQVVLFRTRCNEHARPIASNYRTAFTVRANALEFSERCDHKMHVNLRLARRAGWHTLYSFGSLSDS